MVGQKINFSLKNVFMSLDIETKLAHVFIMDL